MHGAPLSICSECYSPPCHRTPKAADTILFQREHVYSHFPLRTLHLTLSWKKDPPPWVQPATEGGLRARKAEVCVCLRVPASLRLCLCAPCVPVCSCVRVHLYICLCVGL